MLFNSLTFLLFLAVVLPVYYSVGHRKQNLLLLVASYVFYGSWDYRFLLLLWLSTGVDFFLGGRIEAAPTKSRKRALLTASVVGNLTVLGFFKYFNFFADSFVSLLGALGMQADPVTLRVILPVGISFYTFQSLSYTIDVYRGQVKAAKNLPDFALYIAFFPQLVAGPIERAATLLPQVMRPRVLQMSGIMDGIWLIVLGYVKKLIIADRAAEIVALGFQGTALPDATSSWVYLYAFAFQVYGDFSGYSDIARGLSKIMGFNLMVNFRAPYLVTNPTDFWQHWHISLSTWLRDYLFVPLGANRGGSARTYRNLMVTMTLGGLWHGAGWAYLLWGSFQGGLLVVHRWLTPWLKAIDQKVGPTVLRVIGIVAFFHVTCLGWLLFRAGSVARGTDQVGFITRSLMSLASGPLLPPGNLEPTLRAVRVVAFTGALVIAMQAWHDAMERFHSWSWRGQVTAVTMAVALVATLGVFSGAEFIYFQF